VLWFLEGIVSVLLSILRKIDKSGKIIEFNGRNMTRTRFKEITNWAKIGFC
jgi:histidinol phosphatase-like PHP family hydrolase